MHWNIVRLVVAVVGGCGPLDVYTLPHGAARVNYFAARCCNL